MNDNEKIELRPEVQWFAEQMELTLRKNDNKGGWHDCGTTYLLSRTQEELQELDRTIYFNGPVQDIITEAADVANFAMMIADNAQTRSAEGHQSTESA